MGFGLGMARGKDRAAILIGKNGRVERADLAVSVTGVAGPERDERGNAVGTVFIGFSTPEETVAERFDFGEKSRAEIRALSAEEALKLLEEKMKEV